MAVARKASAAKKSAAKKRGTKKSGTKKPAAKKPAAKKVNAKKASAAAKKTSAAKKAAAKKSPAKKPAAKKATPKKPAAKSAASKKLASKRATKKPATKQPSARRSGTPARTARSSAGKAGTTTTMSTTTATNHQTVELPKPRFNKDGFGYTKDFDLSFVKAMHDALQEERVRLTGQAKRLEDEAHQLVEEAEMGDVQFDDEGGEGDTMVVERERDLALSAQAREAVEEIDAALGRIMAGTYGYSVASGRPIPRERLEAIPWSTVLVEEKVGGIGR